MSIRKSQSLNQKNRQHCLKKQTAIPMRTTAEWVNTLRYTIQTRNTIEDSLIENLTISDVIPEGLEVCARNAESERRSRNR